VNVTRTEGINIEVHFLRSQDYNQTACWDSWRWSWIISDSDSGEYEGEG